MLADPGKGERHTARDCTAHAGLIYRLKSLTIGLSVQAPALGIVGGTKGNIRGPQCCVI